MKSITHIVLKLLLIISLIGVFPNAYSQYPEPKNKDGNFKNWEVGINAGLTSFFGDISGYDTDFFGKISHESKMAWGVVISKQFSPEFKLSGQLLSGNLIGKKNNVQIESEIFEYNLHFRMDLIRLANSYSVSPLSAEIYLGLGNFMFNSVKYEYIEGETLTSRHSSRVPEFLYILGAGLGYNFNRKFAITTDISLKQCQNDRVDIESEGGNFDYYTYLYFGVTYKINQVRSKDLRSRTKYVQNTSKRKPKYRPHL